MPEPPGDGMLDALRRVIAGQTKSLAIKLYRQSTGAGPAEAEAAIARMQGGRDPRPAAPVSDEARAIGEALRAGNKIEAIRLYRAATGLGLKEAKDAVEAIMAEKEGPARMNVAAPTAPVVRRRRVSPVLVLLGLAALFGTVFGLVLAFAGR